MGGLRGASPPPEVAGFAAAGFVTLCRDIALGATALRTDTAGPPGQPMAAVLDGLLVLDAGEWMQARLRRRAHTTMHALVVVAELLSAERGRAATDAGDLDMSAGFAVLHEIDPVKNLLVLRT
jgi:hypothetical protein